MMPNTPFLLLLCSLYAAVGSSATTPSPISVDDTSPLLTYSDINDWTTHVNTPAHFNLYDNSDTFSSVQGAWVSFQFNGTEIEYWGNQGPYHGPCRVTLDDGTTEVVSSNYNVDADPILLFSKAYLAENQTHSIRVTVVNGSYPNVCEIDRFVYTPFATNSSTSNPPSSPSSSSSTKYIAIGASVGALVLLLALSGVILFYRRRSRRLTHTFTPGVLDDDLFTSEFNAQMAFTPAPETNTTQTPARPEPTQRPLSATTAHSSSNISKSDMMTSALPTPFPFTTTTSQFSQASPAQYPFQPTPAHLPFPQPTVKSQQQQQLQIPSRQTYSDQSSDEKRVNTAASASSYSGEGSSSIQYYPVVQNPSPMSTPSGGQSLPLHPSLALPPPAAQPVAAPGAGPYQHEDAGRVPEEIPPAYKDSWSPPR